MGVLAERLNAISVKVMSPDRTARLHVDGDGERLEFAPGSLEQHTEQTLSQQLTALYTAALRRQRDALDTVVSDTLAEMSAAADDESTPAPRRGAARDAAAERFDRQAAALTAEGRSPRGDVAVRRHGDERVELTVRKGAVGRWSPEQLVAEVRGALSAADADYRRAYVWLRRELQNDDGGDAR
ncbi:MAG: hypothetical protein ACRDXX_14020 [Stackebrandtia sp.]